MRYINLRLTLTLTLTAKCVKWACSKLWKELGRIRIRASDVLERFGTLPLNLHLALQDSFL